MAGITQKNHFFRKIINNGTNVKDSNWVKAFV